MRNTDFVGKQSCGTLARPDGTDDHFIAELEYRDPIDKASIWLHKQLIKIIREISVSKAWYLGEAEKEPAILLSEMFEVSRNTLCRRFSYYGEQLRRYKPGEVPRDILQRDEKCVRILIARLYWVCRDVSLVRGLARVVERLRVQLTDEGLFEHPDYYEGLDACIEGLVTTFSGISDYFAVCEQKLMTPKVARESETANIRRIAEETHAAVLRLDARDRRAKRQSRQMFPTELQDRVFTIWENGRRNPAVKQLGKSRCKTSRTEVFNYYARDLKSLGIINEHYFAACLNARSDRLRRGSGG